MSRPSSKRPPNHRPEGNRRKDDGDAFFPDPSGGRAKVADDLAEALAEGYLASATSAEEQGEEEHEREVEEEIGGPFVPSTAGKEFADDVDASNPPGSRRAPFPTTRGSS
jgi:hypothetical protein